MKIYHYDSRFPQEVGMSYGNDEDLSLLFLNYFFIQDPKSLTFKE